METVMTDAHQLNRLVELHDGDPGKRPVSTLAGLIYDLTTQVGYIKSQAVDLLVAIEDEEIAWDSQEVLAANQRIVQKTDVLLSLLDQLVQYEKSQKAD
jgi:hypothetical protein